MIVAHVNPLWRLGLGKGIMLPGAANVHALPIFSHVPRARFVDAHGLAVAVIDRQPPIVVLVKGAARRMRATPGPCRRPACRRA